MVAITTLYLARFCFFSVAMSRRTWYPKSIPKQPKSNLLPHCVILDTLHLGQSVLTSNSSIATLAWQVLEQWRYA